MEEDVLKEFVKISQSPQTESKRKFIELAMVLKWAYENVFTGFVYSADKIEARPVVAVILSSVHIFDAKDQGLVTCFPVENVTAIHQLVVEISKETVLRILTEDRTAMRKCFDASIELSIQSRKEKNLIEDSDKVLPSETIAFESYFSAEQMTAWVLDFENLSTRDVFLKVFGNTMMILDALTEEMLFEISGNWIKSWRFVYTPEEVRNKLGKTTSVAAANFHQLLIDFGNLQKPLRILALDKVKLAKTLNSIIPQTFIQKEEYSAELYLPQEKSVKNIIVKFYSDTIQLRESVCDEKIFMEIPVQCTESIVAQPTTEEHKNLFQNVLEEVLVLKLKNSEESLIFATEEKEGMLEKWKKSLSETEIYFQNLVKNMDKIDIRSQLFNGLAMTKKLSLSIKNNSLVFTSNDDGSVFASIGLTQVKSWTLAIKALSLPEPFVFSASLPANEDEIDKINTILYLLKNPDDDFPRSSLKDDSGSDVEINESLSNTEH